ncbi:glycosyltransferase family 39 protein [Pseudomonas fulva]|uniref:ArnT family glycosyltransferase n=1 Tax=Pseudomonas fulva TaxID=47880 RepID=UPI00201D328B|nr:glycosyltransferase family 39 protein [Pseudomonas fulva]UQY36099.1 glycosyltransferase family 39 protein [Pseudomonas fulva]
MLAAIVRRHGEPQTYMLLGAVFLVRESIFRYSVASVVLLFLLIFFRTAWISDDAAITIRTVLNFVNGYGPVFNVGERVQGYTHPSWFILLSLLTKGLGNPYLSAHLLSLLCSLATLSIILYCARQRLVFGLIAVAALVFSKAFVDYSSSGLENPLAHLIIVAAVVVYLRAVEAVRRSDYCCFFFLCALAFLTRPDLALLLLPFSLHLFWRALNSLPVLCAGLACCAVPVLIWTTFSLVYYGFAFPNTAYAKLGAGISLGQRLPQGLAYFGDSLQRDPLTLGFIGIFLSIAMRGGVFNRLSAAGIALYLFYVLSIGGDFMSGRFFTVPLVMAALAFIFVDIGRQWLFAIALFVSALAIWGSDHTLFSGSGYENKVIGSNGIADERGYYFQRTGLIRQGSEELPLPRWDLGNPKVISQCGEMGFESIKSGPGTYVIDPCGLVDPLLARLPAQYDPTWRVGHLYRQLPTDYVLGLERGVNMLADPELRKFYDELRVVVRGDIFSADRWRLIWKLNSASVDEPWYSAFRYGNVPASSLVPIVGIDELARAEGFLFHNALEIAFEPGAGLFWMDLSLDMQSYDIYLLVNGTYVKSLNIPAGETGVTGIRSFRVEMETPIKASRMMLKAVTPGEHFVRVVVLNEGMQR